MSATVLSLGAVGLVWYSLSGFFVSPNIFQIGGHSWLVFTLCIFIFVYNCTKYLDPNFLTVPLTYSAGGLMMTL